MIESQQLEARIVTVGEGEHFPQPHTHFAVVATHVTHRVDGPGWERMWDVVLLFPEEGDE